MSRTYRFLSVRGGTGGGYGDAYTQDGTQYFGFQPRSDGKIAFLRKGYRNVDDQDRGQLSTIADVKTKEEAKMV